MSNDIDWTAPRQDVLAFEEVDPFDLSVRGPVTGVVRDGSTVTWDGEAAVTPIASLSMEGTNYSGDGLVRVTHTVEGTGYSNVLGTFFPTSGELVWRAGRWGGKVGFEGALCAMADDLWETDIMVPVGGSCLDALRRCCDHSLLRLTVAPDVADRYLTVAQVWQAGEPVLSTAHDMAERMRCVLESAPEGGVLLRRRPAEGLTGPTERLYPVGEITVKSLYDRPGRAIAQVSYGGDATSTSYADAAPDVPSSAQRRGRRVALLVEAESDMESPGTAAMAASTALLDALLEPVEHRFSALYAPVRPGDVVVFREGQRDVVGRVRSVDLTLGPGLPISVSVGEEA